MTELIKKTGRVLAPLLVHLGVTFVVAFLGITFHMIWNLGTDEDTLLTSLSALCSIPLLGKMWKADRLQIPSAVKTAEQRMGFLSAGFRRGSCGFPGRQLCYEQKRPYRNVFQPDSGKPFCRQAVAADSRTGGGGACGGRTDL